MMSGWQMFFFFFYSLFFFYCSGFCHTLKWNSHGFTCVPHPDPPSHRPLHPIPLSLPSAPGPSAWLYWFLKLLKKWPMQERHSDWPTFVSAENRKALIWGVAPSVSGGRRTPLSPKTENWTKKPTEAKLVTSLLYYPKCKLCLDSSLTGHPNVKFLCPVNSSQICCFLFVFCLKCISCLLWPLIRFHFYESFMWMN